MSLSLGRDSAPRSRYCPKCVLLAGHLQLWGGGWTNPLPRGQDGAWGWENTCHLPPWPLACPVLAQPGRSGLLWRSNRPPKDYSSQVLWHKVGVTPSPGRWRGVGMMTLAEPPAGLSGADPPANQEHPDYAVTQ